MKKTSVYNHSYCKIIKDVIACSLNIFLKQLCEKKNNGARESANDKKKN